MLDTLDSAINAVNGVLWSYVLIIVLIGLGIYFTIKTKFVQIFYVGEMVRVLRHGIVGHKTKGKEISSFQAFCISTASRVGVGNIAGIAIAVTLGGPGAIFWMWVIALIGSATGFVESTLAQIYKVPFREGGYHGGPAYYIRNALKQPAVAALFAVLITITFALSYNSVQSNTIAMALNDSMGFDTIITGLVLCILTSMVIFGGAHRIAKVTEFLVPIMATLYLIVALVIFFKNLSAVPEMFYLIFHDAFAPQSAVAGGFAAVIMTGIKRGLFSNEAGMGSTPHAHAIARVKHPVEQGLAAIIGLFIDTFIVLTATALVILVTGSLDGTKTGIELTQAAFVKGMGTAGSGFVALCLFFAAFTTIIGWYFFAVQNVKYLFGYKVINIFSVIVLCFLMTGSFLKVNLVWELADMFNGLMVIPNIIAVIGLYKLVVRALDDYEGKFLKGDRPLFGASEQLTGRMAKINTLHRRKKQRS